MNSVLVIGGCGMLGSHIVRMLKEKEPKAEVHVLDLHLTERVDGVEYHQGDITHREDVLKATMASKPDVVFHTASPVHGLGKEVYEKVNVTGTEVVLDVMRELKVKGLVYTSSAAVVFDGSDIINADESQPYAQKHFDAYQETKARAEQAALLANDKDGLRTCALRPAAIFGEGDRQLIPGMLRVLERGQTKYQIGDNMNIFDFTYVGNCAWAHILAGRVLLKQLETPPELPDQALDGQSIFITNSQPLYFWDFCRAVWRCKNHTDASVWTIPQFLGEMIGAISEFVGWATGKEPGLTRFRVMFSCAHRYFDIDKARDILDYQPIVSLGEGIKRSVAWADANTSSAGDKKAQ